MKLYEITNNYKFLEQNDDCDPEALTDTLEAIAGEFEEKALSVSAYFLNQDAEVKAIKAAAKAMVDRAKAIENRSNSLKEYLLTNMQALGISDISCPQYQITLRKPQKVVNVTGELDERYNVRKMTVSPDKVAIKKALKSGEDVKGAELVDGKVSLIIK